MIDDVHSLGQLDLFAQPIAQPGRRAAPSQKPTVQTPLILAFPLNARVGKIRDVAAKLVATKTTKHAEHYRHQVSEAMGVHLRSRRVPLERHADLVRRFWTAVDCEVARRLNGRRRGPGGAA